MRSRPLPLLPFDSVGAENLEWNTSSPEIIAAVEISQDFHCAENALYRIEIFLEPSFHLTRCHLWLLLYAGIVGTWTRPVRIAGPLRSEQLMTHGWFGFEFAPIEQSAKQRFTFVLTSPDGTPGNALRVRAHTAPAAVAFRAVCLKAPALRSNFERYRDHAQQRGRIVSHQPLLARLEISRPCNLRCIMCQRGQHPFDARQEAPGFLSLKSLRGLDPVLPTLLRVIALGLGEPFLNPQLLSILRHVRASNPFAHVFTSTNGTRLDDSTIDALLDENLISELQISLDGIERESFEQIRPNASLAVVLSSIERVLKAKAKRGKAMLDLTVAMLVMKPNFREVFPFVKRMTELGVDRISLDSPKDAAFKALRVDSDLEMAHVFDQVAQSSEWAVGSRTQLSGPLLSELAAWHRASGQRMPLPRWGVDECARLRPPASSRATACPVPWESFTLATDGSVNVCCNSIRRMGHVDHEGILPAWMHGAAYTELRDELITGALHRDCATCLGENFVVPGETTPIIYLEGCQRDDGGTARRAELVGQRISTSPGTQSVDWCGGIDSVTNIRVQGWIRPTAGTKPLAQANPQTVVLARDGIIRDFGVATPVTDQLYQWCVCTNNTRAISGTPTFDLFVLDGETLHRVQRAPDDSAEWKVAAADDVHGFIDEVTLTKGAIHFRGWARDRRGARPAARVVLKVNGQTAAMIRPWLPRPDVAKAFGDKPACYGFSLELPIVSLATVSLDKIAIVAANENGGVAPLEWSAAARAGLHDAVTAKTARAAAARRASADPTCSMRAVAWSRDSRAADQT